MRIAYVCADPGIPVFGTKGASVHVQEVLRELVACGHAVELFCTRVGGTVPDGLDDVVVHQVPPRTHDRSDPAARELAAMGADDDIVSGLEDQSGFDLVYERYSLWGGSGVRHGRRTGVPAVLEVNAPLIEEQARYRTLVHTSAATARLREMLVAAPTVVCVSEPVADWVREHGALRAHVVSNGVRVERFTPAVTMSDSAAPVTIGFLGTLKRWHGVEALMAAFARMDETIDARLLLVGDGPCAPSLRAQARRLRVADRVELTGSVPPSAVPSLLSRMDVAVAPYPRTTGETFYFSPLKIYEYLAAGLPIVASHVGQIGSVLTQGVDGILVPPGDLEALAGSLTGLATNPRRRLELGAAARRTAVERHGWDRAVDRILHLTGVSAASVASAVGGRS